MQNVHFSGKDQAFFEAYPHSSTVLPVFFYYANKDASVSSGDQMIF